MTDRELLELAAKAVGKVITGWNTRHGVDVAVLDDGSYWQPLLNNSITDTDGDAMRLAVELKFQVLIGQGPDGDITWIRALENLDIDGASERHGPDAASATRRAIVRAAAEIGRNM